MQQIVIEIKDRRARTLGSPSLVCNNEGYAIKFIFDEEWADLPVKTARFVYSKDCEVKKQDIPFEGDTVEIPKLSGIHDVRVGVYAGDLMTTTPAWVPFVPSVLCQGGTPDEPTEDVYNQIMELFNSIVLAPGTPVDQEFNPESENPLSGKALAALILTDYNGEELQERQLFSAETTLTLMELVAWALDESLQKKEASANKTQTIDEHSTTEQYASARAVYNFGNQWYQALKGDLDELSLLIGEDETPVEDIPGEMGGIINPTPPPTPIEPTEGTGGAE